jgi:hypothetical protein
MSLTFTSGFVKPNAVLDKPGNLGRPAFGTLYGFDAPQEEVIDGAIFTEFGEALTTEQLEILLFEPA